MVVRLLDKDKPQFGCSRKGSTYVDRVGYGALGGSTREQCQPSIHVAFGFWGLFCTRRVLVSLSNFAYPSEYTFIMSSNIFIFQF